MKPLYPRSEIRIAPDPRGTESSVNTSRLVVTNRGAPEVLLGRIEDERSATGALRAVYRGNARDLSYGALGNFQVTARPASAVALRFGLAVASVATALGTTLILRYYGFPPRFISHFTLIAIAVTFWCAGTGPGLLALFLSCLGVSVLARDHLLLPGFPIGILPYLLTCRSGSCRFHRTPWREALDNGSRIFPRAVGI